MKSSLLYKWCKIYKTERPIAYVTAKAQKRISSHNWLIFPIYLGLSKEANLTFCPLVSFFKFALGILGDLKPARQNTTKNNFFSRSILVAYSLLNIENKPKGNPLASIFYNLKRDWDFFFLSSFLTDPEICLDLVVTALACYWNLPFCLLCCFQILKEEISLWWVSMFSQAAVMHPHTSPILNLRAENQCLMLLNSSLYLWLKKWSDSSHSDFYPISFSFHVGGFRWKAWWQRRRLFSGTWKNIVEWSEV